MKLGFGSGSSTLLLYCAPPMRCPVLTLPMLLPGIATESSQEPHGSISRYGTTPSLRGVQY
eukprot:1008438-Rhodomonas_salina.8